MLLAIDTSGATAVAVLAADGTVLADCSDTDPRGHAEHIGPLLERAMREAGGPAIEGVAYGVGPGPFTGLRVGMAAARTAALVFGAVELPVLSHDAIAYDAHCEGRAVPFVVVADAKRREHYFTAYRSFDAAGVPLAVDGPRVGPEADLPDLPRVEAHVRAFRLGQVALLRRTVGIAAPSGEARYLRSPDVTPAPARKSVLG